MKNKKNYILLGLVVAIWGYAMFSFFGAFHPTVNNNLTFKKSFLNLKGEDDLKEDSFVLLANYKDPFLGKIFSPNRTISVGTVVKAKKKEVVIKVPEPPVDLSFITFVGLIRNPGNNKRVALVSINNNQHMASEGEVIENVLFLKNFKDSIGIVIKDKTYYIKRK